MKKIARFIPLGPAVVVLCLLSGCVHGRSDEGTVFQNAPLSGLMAGCYSGTMSVRDLRAHGDFGIGTLDSLDGEMIVLDHVFYQIKPDGQVHRLQERNTSPFATVTFFKPEQILLPVSDMTYRKYEAFLDSKLSSKNLIFAIRVEGKFPFLKVRSASRQKAPFRVLTEAIGEQKIFEWNDREGTLVGFRFPSYVGGINVPGYHFHFLNKDRTFGGHVLDFHGKDLQIQIMGSHGFFMQLPANAEFLASELANGSADAVAKVEKSSGR